MYYLLYAVVEVFALAFFISKCLGIGSRNTIVKWVTLFLLVIIYWGTKPISQGPWAYLWSVILFLSVYFVGYQGNSKKAIGIYVFCMLLFNILAGMNDCLFKAIQKITVVIIPEDAPKLISSVITFLFFLICYYCILKKDGSVLLNIKKHEMALLLVLMLANLLIILLTAIIIEIGLGGKRLILMIIVTDLMMYFQVAIMVKLFVTNEWLNISNTKNQYFLQLQADQYDYIKTADTRTARFRHDIKNHIDVIRDLARNGDNDSLIKYVDEVWESTREIAPQIQVNNDVADAVLNRYKVLFDENSIEFVVTGFFKRVCSIAMFDICTILSNILQNAYEASVQCDKKKVLLKIKDDDTVLCIEESNYCVDLLHEDKGVLLSSKIDKSLHGFGMQNVNESVKKYGGTLDYDVINDGEEKKFCVRIIIPHV